MSLLSTEDLEHQSHIRANRKIVNLQKEIENTVGHREKEMKKHSARPEGDQTNSVGA
jgi:hypothetical protein